MTCANQSIVSSSTFNSLSRVRLDRSLFALLRCRHQSPTHMMPFISVLPGYPEPLNPAILKTHMYHVFGFLGNRR
jgi:hypothetical protein